MKPSTQSLSPPTEETSSSTSGPSLTERAEFASQSWLDDAPDKVAVDTETEGVAFFDNAFCVTLTWRNKEGLLVNHYIELTEEDHAGVARSILLGTPSWLFHNAKFDLQKLILAGVLNREEVSEDRFEDTEALAHLDDENRRKGLKLLARTLLGEDTSEEVELKRAMRKHGFKLEDGYHMLPRECVIPYALKDTEFTYRLYELFLPLVNQYEDLWGLYEHEKAVCLTLLDMEAAGLRIDDDYVAEQLSEFSTLVLDLERRISEIVGKPIGKDTKAGEFNPASNPQLKEYFQSQGFDSPSYDKHFLANCADPLAQVLTEYRRAVRFKNTYFLAIRDEARDSILHPNFRQHGTRTGRMSSGGAEAE